MERQAEPDARALAEDHRTSAPGGVLALTSFQQGRYRLSDRWKSAIFATEERCFGNRRAAAIASSLRP